MKKLVYFVRLAGLTLFLMGPNASHAAALIRTQAPCLAQGLEHCVRFNNENPPNNFTVRSYSFTAPSAGSAQVTFHGSMLCSSFGSFPETVYVETQITNDSRLVAEENGPGGLLHYVKLPIGGYATFNLASTRVFAIPTAGRRNYHLELHWTQLGDGTECTIHNAAFSVVFIP